jgi:hypothetical protein
MNDEHCSSSSVSRKYGGFEIFRKIIEEIVV